jgi:hypothetical protein
LIDIFVDRVQTVTSDGASYDRHHASVTYEGDEVDEAALSCDPVKQAAEVKLLRDSFVGFDGTYEEACDLVEVWIVTLEESDL